MIPSEPLPNSFRTATSPVAPEDRRRHPRRRIGGVLGTLRSPGDLAVLDLSLTGLAAEATGEIAPGQRCYVELVHEGHRVNVEAAVRWAWVARIERQNDRSIPVFRAGLSFIDIARDGSGGIWDWLVAAPEAAPARAAPKPERAPRFSAARRR